MTVCGRGHVREGLCDLSTLFDIFISAILASPRTADIKDGLTPRARRGALPAEEIPEEDKEPPSPLRDARGNHVTAIKLL